MRTMTLAITFTALACGSPAPARKTVTTQDTAAAFGHVPVDTTGMGANRRAAARVQNTDSINAVIRASQRGTTLPAPKRIERKSP